MSEHFRKELQIATNKYDVEDQLQQILADDKELNKNSAIKEPHVSSPLEVLNYIVEIKEYNEKRSLTKLKA